MLAVGLDVSDVFSNLSVSVILSQEHGVLETSSDMLQIDTAGMILWEVQTFSSVSPIH